MRRTNQRFNKRVKVRDSIEERLIYAEKLNELLARSSNVQHHINLELRGKCDNVNRKMVKALQRIKDLENRDGNGQSDHQAYLVSLGEDLQALANKVDVMEEVLEDIA